MVVVVVFALQGLVNNVGLVPGLLLSSALFGLAHSFAPSDLWFLALFGLYNGVIIILAGGNVAVPAVCHSVFDTLVLLAAYVRGIGHLTDPRQQHLMPNEDDK